MRALLVLAAVACAALGLVVFLGTGREDARPGGDAPIERRVEPAPRDTPDAAVDRELIEPDTGEREADSSSPAPTRVEDPLDVERTRDWRIRGRLVTADDGEPLEGYTIFVQPSGTKPRGALEAAGTTETDADGMFGYDELDRRGPFDVFAYPLDPRAAERRLSLRRRIGFARAARPGDETVQTFRVAVGPLVILRSPLPAGVADEDLLLEARGRISLFSSQIGGAGGFARAAPLPSGFRGGRIPHVTNSVQDVGFGVRAVTLDGLWSIAERREERLTNGSEVLIDATLQPRGRVVVELVSDRPGEEDEGDDVGRMAASLGWTLPLGDPERDDLGLPETMATTERNRRLVPLGGGRYAIHDLPIGPVELRTRTSAGGGTGSGGSGGGAYEIAVPVQARAVHGDGDPVTVRMRRRR
ncbi:MAG: hypothetical protein AAGI22_12370 [Planctomycetota bacterium]